MLAGSGIDRRLLFPFFELLFPSLGPISQTFGVGTFGFSDCYCPLENRDIFQLFAAKGFDSQIARAFDDVGFGLGYANNIAIGVTI